MVLEKDEESAKLIKLVNNIRLVFYGLVLALFVLIVVVNLFSGGISSAIGNALVMLIVSFVLVAIIDKLIIPPISWFFYGKIVNLITSSLTKHNIKNDVLTTWKKNFPGVFVVDIKKKQIFIESIDTDYYPVILEPKNMISLKIERESTVHTTTKHGGSFAVFGSSMGYKFGSKSKSTSKIEELAFLEIQFKHSENEVPKTVVIPYGADRRRADQVLSTIRAF